MAGDTRRALLVHGDRDQTSARAQAAIRQIAETLLGAEESWRVRRLIESADRLGVKRELDELVTSLSAATFVVIAGTVVTTGDGPALCVGAYPDRYPDESTLPLAWIRQRLVGHRGLVVVLAVDDASRVSFELEGALSVVARGDTDDVLATLAAALAGGAQDATTGTVTRASLGRYLAAALPAATVGASEDRETLLSPRPLGQLDDLLESRVLSLPAVAAVGDLAGFVLPGRFRIDCEIARGSFGTVYRAHQLAVGRDVAVKVVNREIDPRSAAGRLFLQEIHAVGRIDHPSVVRIYQADIAHDGRLFFAMELLAGRTLQALVDDGPVSMPRALELVAALLSGLGAAHDAGLVHADVKPANAMVVEGRGGERVVLLDFGLARLRRTDEHTDSAGGTPAFMAPEQLRDGRVDARSDLFAAALVLVALVTGWRRRRAADLVPPLEPIIDARVREVLTRALALDPADRFATASQMAAALRGEAHTATRAAEHPPFRRLASFTEADHERLFGRGHDLAALTEHALFRPAVVLTAPSGTGKTSLLRAGLRPHLERLGSAVVYVSARSDAAAAIVAAATPDARRLVILIDQLEALLGDATADGRLSELLALGLRVSGDVSVVLSVREDYLARLLARRELASASAPIVRIGPIDAVAARDAIVQPLAERRIEIADELLDRLLLDLTAMASALAPELGWPAAPSVYPPHLQLAGAVLFESLGSHEATLTLAHYQRLGGLEVIIGEHLERVLDAELDPAAATIARSLFLALVTSTHARAARTEDELVAMTDGAPASVLAVLDVLRAQGLLVRTQRSDGDPVWELIHDSLVPRIQGWIDRRDLSRRSAIEQVRFHVRRSRAGVPSLLSRAELRELDAYDGVVPELEAEHARRGATAAWSPTRLVARSRQVLRRTTAAAFALGATVAAVVGIAAFDRYAAAAASRREESRRDRDLGRFVLELRPFDWTTSGAMADVPATDVPRLRWTLHDPDPDDPRRPGEEMSSGRMSTRPDPATPNRFRIEASGGAAFLVVTGRERSGERPCAPSVIPLRAIPGYSRRGQAAPLFTVRVPTCGASTSNLVAVPAGRFVQGGPGEPPSQVQLEYRVPEREVHVDAFAIDRTEVTNAAFAAFAGMASLTGIGAPLYAASNELISAGEPDRPVSAINWYDARAYCAFLGKRLPSNVEWQKAARGGLTLADDTANPYPRRNLPWGAPVEPIPANVNDGVAPAPAPVGSHPGDVSPYGVLDLAGNVHEWTSSVDEAGLIITRGGNWAETHAADLHEFVAIENPRPPGLTAYFLGVRCAI
ncbi:MAG TPA: SUMF1/EgtB/PvdO family nonheme iron enzyme [Kofleriaceae bacterium]|nr:SUMF1/EgtB/PvdO family nonheme iron enzyme [Kofleriaceae bacterium]